MDKNRTAGSSKCLISETSKKSSQGGEFEVEKKIKNGRHLITFELFMLFYFWIFFLFI